MQPGEDGPVVSQSTICRFEKLEITALQVIRPGYWIDIKTVLERKISPNSLRELSFCLFQIFHPNIFANFWCKMYKT